MRDIKNRLNEAVGSQTDVMAEQLMAAIDDFVSNAIDSIESIIMLEGLALSASMPGYIIVLGGGHGMTDVTVLPPKVLADHLEAIANSALEDQIDETPAVEFSALVNGLNDDTGPNYFKGYKIADSISRFHPSISFTEFGDIAFADGKQIPAEQADAYMKTLTPYVQSQCRH